MVRGQLAEGLGMVRAGVEQLHAELSKVASYSTSTQTLRWSASCSWVASICHRSPASSRSNRLNAWSPGWLAGDQMVSDQRLVDGGHRRWLGALAGEFRGDPAGTPTRMGLVQLADRNLQVMVDLAGTVLRPAGPVGQARRPLVSTRRR